MNLQEYAKYVIDNMHRASLSNALNIAKALYDNNEKGWDIKEFIRYIDEYIGSTTIQEKLGRIKVFNILVDGDKCLKALTSDKKYNKTMIIDNYIIAMWEAFQQ